jgi:hypothetical protein
MFGMDHIVFIYNKDNLKKFLEDMKLVIEIEHNINLSYSKDKKKEGLYHIYCKCKKCLYQSIDLSSYKDKSRVTKAYNFQKLKVPNSSCFKKEEPIETRFKNLMSIFK